MGQLSETKLNLKCHSPIVASGHQPGGLADSSRWLKRSENHRNNRLRDAPRRGARISKRISFMQFSSGTPSGCNHSCLLNRWSSLRYDHRLLSCSPSGWLRVLDSRYYKHPLLRSLIQGSETKPLSVPKCIPNNASRRGESTTSNTGNP